VLPALVIKHNASLPDFDLLSYKNPRQWIGALAELLFVELNHRDPHLFDPLRAN
jgi:hypothetical protein